MCQVMDVPTILTAISSMRALTNPTAMSTVSSKMNTSSTATSSIVFNKAIHRTFEEYRQLISNTKMSKSVLPKTATSMSESGGPVRMLLGKVKSAKTGLKVHTPVMADGSIRGPQCVVM